MTDETLGVVTINRSLFGRLNRYTRGERRASFECAPLIRFSDTNILYRVNISIVDFAYTVAIRRKKITNGKKK